MDNLVTLQDLFKNSVFKVPDYQRGYSWENVHRRDLLDDLEAIHVSHNQLEKERRHYTGTVVLQSTGTQPGFGESYKRFDVVDGQQRLTTIVILLKATVKELNQIQGEKRVEAQKVANNIMERYLTVEGPQGSIFKLSLDEDNDLYFKQAIIGDKKDVEQTIKSHNNLLKAKDQFGTYFIIPKSIMPENDYFTFLTELTYKITQLLVFTVYNIEDNSEVGVIFEVMNDRGKKLSELEKVKNLLMYMTNRVANDPTSSTQLTKKINYSWREILQNMARAQKFDSEDEDQFLRVNAIISFYSDLVAYTDDDDRKVSVNSQLADIHGLLKRKFKELEKDRASLKVKAYKEIDKYVDSLRSTSYRFRDLLQPYENFAFQQVQNSRVKNELRLVSAQLNRMDVEATLLPLSVAVYERFISQPEIQLALLRNIEIFAFRVYGIARWRPYTAQTTMRSLATEILRGDKTEQDITESLQTLATEYVLEDLGQYLKDPKFDFYDWNSLRYFLYEYERHQCAKEGKKPYFEWEDLEKKNKEDSIEHILPQTIRDDNGKILEPFWCKRFTVDTHASELKRLGNLTLTDKNSFLGNKGFDKKKEIYKGSHWEIERELIDFPNWTEKQIEEREKSLIEFANKRWAFK